MVYENNTGIEIPAVFVSESTGLALYDAAKIPHSFVIINELYINGRIILLVLTILLLGVSLVFTVVLGCAWLRYMRELWQRRSLHAPLLDSIPTQKYNKDLNYDTCAICQANFNHGDMLRILPCAHAYHIKCIDPWLTEYKRECPVCKLPIRVPGEEESAQEDVDDRTPLLRSHQRSDLLRRYRPIGLLRSEEHSTLQRSQSFSIQSRRQLCSVVEIGERNWTRSNVTEAEPSQAGSMRDTVTPVDGEGSAHGDLEQAVRMACPETPGPVQNNGETDEQPSEETRTDKWTR
ncbi:hypothetical protein WDU94_000639 [Cyamophila willieti]